MERSGKTGYQHGVKKNADLSSAIPVISFAHRRGFAGVINAVTRIAKDSATYDPAVELERE